MRRGGFERPEAYVGVMARAVSALLLVAAIGTTPASAVEAVHATVTRTVFAHDFVDGTARAAFRSEGTCPAASETVAVDVCTPDGATGSVRSALFGFDARHTVEAAPVDAPAVQTGVRSAPQQSQHIRVVASRAGQLGVRIEPSPDAGISATPVSESAVPSAKVDGRAVEWTVAAHPGAVYDFRVNYLLEGSPAGSLDSFVPGLRVSLTGDVGVALESADGPAPIGAAGVRTAEVVMMQRDAIGTVKPVFGDAPFFGPTPQGALAFGGTAAVDAPTDYDARVSGEVVRTYRFGAKAFVPDLESYGSLSFVMGYTLGKLEFVLDVFGDTLTLRTARPSAFPSTNPVPSPLYAGDSVGIAAAVAAISSRAREQRAANGSDGRMVSEWHGERATAWATVSANNAPMGEPNGLNVAALEYTPFEPMFGPYGRTLVSAFSVPVSVADGDIDNTGTEPVAGQTSTFTPPPGHEVHRIISSTTFPISEARLHTETTGSGITDLGGLRATPVVEPGGTWLQTTGTGSSRDWVGGYKIIMESTPAGATPPPWDPPALLHVVVPTGATGVVGLWTLRGHDSIRLPAGRYVLDASGDRIIVAKAHRS